MYEGSVLYNLFAVKPLSILYQSPITETQTKSPSFQQIQGRAKKREAVINQQKQESSRRKSL